MEILFSLGFFVVASICVLAPGMALAVIVGYFIIKNNLKSSADRKELLLTGVTEPAIILSARNNYSAGGGRHSPATRVNVTFEVEVQPGGQAPFKTSFSDWLSLKSGERGWPGERSGDAGQKVWVTYDPQNFKRMVFDHYDSNHDFAMQRKAFENIDRRDAGIRKTGESAQAIILEVEDLKLTNAIERDHMKSTIMRLRLEVTPKDGAVYQAETQGLFSNASLHKYAVGKRVNVKLNPQDWSQVTIVNSAEEGA